MTSSSRMNRKAQAGFAVLAFGVLAIAGCSESYVLRPSLDPAVAADRAMEQFDANHDGKIDAKEMASSPALMAMAQTARSGPDKPLTRDDLIKRMQAWMSAPKTVFSIRLTLTLNSVPIDGATVVLEPEKFLTPEVEAAEGVTDSSGTVALVRVKSKQTGVFPGAYNVRVSKPVNGKETIPAKFNEKAEVGLEIANDLPIGNPRVGSTIDLRSK